LNIIARKPKDRVSEWVVVDRGEGHDHRFVSATASEQSLSSGEWFWGHYFRTREEAIAHFDDRERVFL